MTLLKHDEGTSRDSDETRRHTRQHVVENGDYSSIINGMQHRVDQAMENFGRSINTQVGRLKAGIKVARSLPFSIRIPKDHRCPTERLYLFIVAIFCRPKFIHQIRSILTIDRSPPVSAQYPRDSKYRHGVTYLFNALLSNRICHR